MAIKQRRRVVENTIARGYHHKAEEFAAGASQLLRSCANLQFPVL
jgi:hypothetical protein